jgi:UDP-glucuronate decarboxylase
MNRIINEDIESICQEEIDWSFFSGKNILITGANGILASYITETFLSLSKSGIIHDTRIFALSRNRENALAKFHNHINDKCFKLIIQDVNESIFSDERFDIIIHAASQASPRYYGVDPVGTLMPNIVGTHKLLNLANEKGTQNFIFFSSAEVYGNNQNSGSIKETDFGSLDPLDIRSCYAESKRMGENLCISWHTQYGIPVKIIRPFHTYGPGMTSNDGRIFADFVFNILNNQNIVIKSDGKALRSYCYLKDAVLGYFYIILKGAVGEAYNVGNSYQELSVKDLAGILIQMFPEKQLKIEMNPRFDSINYIPSSVNRFLPDISKIEKLGWSPKTDVQTGFKRTILSYSF